MLYVLTVVSVLVGRPGTMSQEIIGFRSMDACEAVAEAMIRENLNPSAYATFCGPFRARHGRPEAWKWPVAP